MGNKAYKGQRILILGLEKSGKTTLLNQLKYGSAEGHKKTKADENLEFNVEKLSFKGVKCDVWDLEVQSSSLWKHYYMGTSGIIWVMTMGDAEKVEESCTELHRVIIDRELDNVKFVIFVNKMDSTTQIDEEEVKKVLGLDKITNKKYKVFIGSARSGQGVNEALDWLVSHITSD